jgi:phage terminase large subunit-like protein
MPKYKEPEFTMGDIFAGLAERITKSAVLPNLTRYEPHKKQYAFHCNQRKGRLYIGGNRAGKTIANVLECLWWITKTHPYRELPSEPIRGRLTCVDFPNGLDKIILPLFKQWLPSKYLINNNWDDSWSQYHKTLTLNNGSFIEFMSYDQDLDKFAGTSRHFVCFDEEPPKTIFNECRARIVDTGGVWWISMTPVDGMTWVYDDIFEPYETDPINCKHFVIQADMLDNPHISPEDAEEFLSGLDPKERAAREHGTFVQLGGRVFKKFDPDVHKVKFDFKFTDEMRIYTSIDIGWAHPTAWLWHAVEPNGHITTFHEMVESFVTIEEWAQRVKQFEKDILEPVGLKVYLRTGDPALKQTRSNTGTSDIQEYARHGIYLAVESVPREVNIGLVKIEQYMRPDDDPRENGRPFWQYTENCRMLAHQMARLRWATYASKKLEHDNAPKGTIHKKDDDAPDSLRYFMTLMPDLKFAIVEKSVRDTTPTYLNASIADFDLNRVVMPEQKYASIYEVHETESNWGLEN